jgi:predicted transcriptional regulator
MHNALHQTYASLMTLKAQEEGTGVGAVESPKTPRVPIDWQKSITKQTVTCLECGASFKQLSVKHLREHGLDGRSYWAK